LRIPGTLRIARPDYTSAIESLERSSQILAPPEGLLNREERDSEMNGSEQECCCSAITGCESRIWRRFGKTAIKNDFIFLHAVKMGRDLVATLSRVKTAFDCLPVPARCSQKLRVPLLGWSSVPVTATSKSVDRNLPAFVAMTKCANALAIGAVATLSPQRDCGRWEARSRIARTSWATRRSGE
jgi:hypothetical protein